MSRDPADYSIAFGLALGLVPAVSSKDMDMDIERAGRRARWERRKARQRRDAKEF